MCNRVLRRNLIQVILLAVIVGCTGETLGPEVEEIPNISIQDSIVEAVVFEQRIEPEFTGSDTLNYQFELPSSLVDSLGSHYRLDLSGSYYSLYDGWLEVEAQTGEGLHEWRTLGNGLMNSIPFYAPFPEDFAYQAAFVDSVLAGRMTSTVLELRLRVVRTSGSEPKYLPFRLRDLVFTRNSQFGWIVVIESDGRILERDREGVIVRQWAADMSGRRGSLFFYEGGLLWRESPTDGGTRLWRILPDDIQPTLLYSDMERSFDKMAVIGDRLYLGREIYDAQNQTIRFFLYLLGLDQVLAGAEPTEAIQDSVLLPSELTGPIGVSDRGHLLFEADSGPILTTDLAGTLMGRWPTTFGGRTVYLENGVLWIYTGSVPSSSVALESGYHLLTEPMIWPFAADYPSP